MTTRVTERDHGANALLRRFRGGVTIRVGILGDAAHASHPKAGMSVGELSSLHELGIGVPRRSFLRDTFDQDWPETKKRLHHIPLAVLQGVPVSTAAARFGGPLAEAIVASIDANIPPPLAALTVAMKGHDLALVDTGTLRSAVSYEVEVDQ